MHKDVIKQLVNRAEASHKYDFGHVLVIGGSPGMVGAPLLAAEAALRVGAGLVTIGSVPEVTSKLQERVVEIMTLDLPADKLQETAFQFIKERKVTVIAIGPGMKGQLASLLGPLITTTGLPLIIDGGALGLLAREPDILKGGRAGIVLTPHLGEFQRFFDTALPDTPSELQRAAREFATRHKVTLVLKGHPTYVIHKDGKTYENHTGGPELATAGTGDVLAGMIAGIIAQGIDIEAAAEAAVYLHGLSGDHASSTRTQAGVIASDVIENIPNALRTGIM